MSEELQINPTLNILTQNQNTGNNRHLPMDLKKAGNSGTKPFIVKISYPGGAGRQGSNGHVKAGRGISYLLCFSVLDRQAEFLSLSLPYSSVSDNEL